VGDVGPGSEQPERREAEGGDRAQLDRIARRLAYGESGRIGLVLVSGPRRCLDPADELDRDAQKVPGGRLVEPRAADEARQHELGGLVDTAAGEREQGSDRALRQRYQEGEAGGHR